MPHTLQGRIRTLAAGFIALGLLAILLPSLSTVAAELTTALTLFFWGILGTAFALYTRPAPEWRIAFPAFVAMTGIAALLVVFPRLGIEMMTLLAIAGLLAEGVFSILHAARLPGGQGPIWLSFSGFAALGIGLVVLWGWPGTAAWFLGLLLGANFIATGLSLIAVAAGIRSPGASG